MNENQVLELVAVGTKYGDLFTKYAGLKDYLKDASITVAVGDKVVKEDANNVIDPTWEIASKFIVEIAKELKNRLFNTLTSQDQRFDTIEPLMIPKHEAKNIKPVVTPVFARISSSTDAPDRRKTDSTTKSGYADYSSENYAWRIGFDVIVDMKGAEVPFTEQLTSSRVSFGYDSELYKQYSMLTSPTIVLLNVTTSDTHKHYPTLDSFKRMILSNESANAGMNAKIEKLWRAHAVSDGNDGERVVLNIPNREAKFDLNAMNVSTPTILRDGRSAIAKRFCEAADQRQNNVLVAQGEKDVFDARADLREAEEAEMFASAQKMVKEFAKFGETITMREALRDIREDAAKKAALVAAARK